MLLNFHKDFFFFLFLLITVFCFPSLAMPKNIQFYPKIYVHLLFKLLHLLMPDYEQNERFIDINSELKSTDLYLRIFIKFINIMSDLTQKPLLLKDRFLVLIGKVYGKFMESRGWVLPSLNYLKIGVYGN